MLRRICVLLVIILTIFIVSGCTEEQVDLEPISQTRFMLDTVCSITVFGVRDSVLIDDAFELLAEYEALFSVSIEGSDIWRINHAGGASVAVAPQTLKLIRLGVEFGVLSDGLFDITVGRLSSLWDFKGLAVVPSLVDLEMARGTVDFRQIFDERGSVRLGNPDAWLDLGGIAKGFIADRLGEFLVGRGAVGAVVDLGGDVVVVGEKPDGSPWRLGVRHPFGERGDLLGVVETGVASVVSSGVYERRFEENGVIYHHILDPFTGFPSRSDVVSATVVAESAVIGDIISTIAILVGSEKAGELLGQVNGFIGALLVLEDGELIQFGDISFMLLG